jgi:hypothetical protein
MPDPGWMLVLWCGTNPALDYNGGFVLSRGRTQDGMPAEERFDSSQSYLRLFSPRFLNFYMRRWTIKYFVVRCWRFLKVRISQFLKKAVYSNVIHNFKGADKASISDFAWKDKTHRNQCKMSSTKKIDMKRTLRQFFIRVYRDYGNFVRTFSHVGIFNPALWSVLSLVAPLPFSLLQLSPLPPSPCEWVLTYTVCKGGRGGRRGYVGANILHFKEFYTLVYI